MCQKTLHVLGENRLFWRTLTFFAGMLRRYLQRILNNYFMECYILQINVPVENNGHCQSELFLPLCIWRDSHFLEKEYCIILKETLHTSRGGNTANFARVLSTASLKGHVAFKSWYVFLSFRYCILEMKKCLFEKELSLFKKCCIFWMKVASFKKHCTCVQGCLKGISHRFQVGYIVKGDTASFVKGYCTFCQRRVSFLKELCGLYVCVCMPNFVKGDLVTLHLKCLFEKKICF